MGKELLLIAETVSNQIGIDRDIVLSAIEEALVMATQKHLGVECGIRVEMDRKTGDYRIFRYWDVVSDDDEMEFPDRQLKVDQAKEKKPDASVGDHIEEELKGIKLGRIGAQMAKQVILQRVRTAERELAVKNYEELIGTIIIGVVKKTTRDNIILELSGKAEAILPRADILPNEIFRPSDRVRVYLSEVKEHPKGPQLYVSRTHPQMLAELFRIEVPEVGEEIIQVKAAARDPGYRAKVAVHTNDGRIDPVGACVGMRGARVQAVSSELCGERVDVILWDEDPAKFVINAMAPAEIASIIVKEDTHVMDLEVEDAYLSQAIGRSGQNVRLASELTGWTLNVMDSEAFKQKNQEESEAAVENFIEQLEIDEDIAQILTQAGFSTLEEIAYVPKEELLEISEFDEDIVDALRSRANDALLEKALTTGEFPTPEKSLLEMEGMDEELAFELAKRKIVSMEDLAEQSVGELLDIEGLTGERAAALIMKAREPWFLEKSE